MELSRSRHSCHVSEVRTPDDSAEKTNVVWEPSKDFKHLNLKMLQMSGFEEEDKVTTYIRLVMERAVGLKKIELQGYRPCWACNATDADRKSQVDEASRRRIKERLTNGSSSSVEIIICSQNVSSKALHRLPEFVIQYQHLTEAMEATG